MTDRRGWLLLLAGALVGCQKSKASDEALVTEDRILVNEYVELHDEFMHGRMKPDAYVGKLRELRQHELDIFARAVRRQFTNLESSDYFIRQRLKFPSPIQTELERMEQARRLQ